MVDDTRRTFLKAGGALAVSGLLTRPDLARGEAPSVAEVRFMGDGLGLSPTEYTRRVADLAARHGFSADTYASGGVIAELEAAFARHLGKETAVFLPTGTLANHIAMRRLTGPRRRVIVQHDSHLYNDSGDCAQRLSGLNLLPVSGDFDPAAVVSALRVSRSGRVTTEVGAISLESPLRRGYNTTHTLDQIAALADLARHEGLGLHLDGARLFMQAAHQGHTPEEYAAHFDTVYVSLYKNFNAAGGAVLAGPRSLLADLHHERRMFGGSPCHAWPLAALALQYVDDFAAEYVRARLIADRLYAELSADPRFRIEEIPGGSNSAWLHLRGVDPAEFVQRLSAQNIAVIPPRPQWGGLLLMINPTLGRTSAAELSAAFLGAADSR